MPQNRRFAPSVLLTLTLVLLPGLALAGSRRAPEPAAPERPPLRSCSTGSPAAGKR